MAIQYLKNEAGALEVDEKSGNPLVYDDVKDPEKKSPFPLDGISLYSKIPALNEEAKSHRLKAKEFEEKLKAYEDLDPVKAREAIEKLKGLEAGDLTKAEEVEKLKKEITTAYEGKINDIQKAYETKVSELSNSLEEKKKALHDSALSRKFAESKYFSGDNRLTVLFPDIAQSYFGQDFQVEEDGEVVGCINGNKVMSQADPLRVADFDEVIGMLLDNHPRKDSLMRAAPGGSGAHGNAGDVRKTSISRTVFESMDAAAKYKFATGGGVVKD